MFLHTTAKRSLNFINCQSYKSIKEVLIADDGDEPLDMTGCKYPVKYFKMNRIALGVKRNFLKNCVKSGYVACFDTDDFYHPNHIENAMTELAMAGKSVAGSADELKIDDVMVCVAHKTNTVTKDKWLDEKYVTSFEILNPYRHHLEILSHVNI